VCGGGVSFNLPTEECGAVVGRKPTFTAALNGVETTDHWLIQVNMCNKAGKTNAFKGGDSGGPWVKFHRAFGLTIGGAGCLEYYEGINEAEYAVHVNVVSR
jgi:hypothetical protein